MAKRGNIFAGLFGISGRKKAVPIQNNVVQVGTYTEGPVIVYSESWTGEKTPGELGLVKKYLPNYAALRFRSWQFLEENPLMQIAVNTYATWLVGSGCKIEPEPQADVLRMYGINLERDDLRRLKQQINGLFSLRAESRQSDWSEQGDLHTQARYGLINAIVGGDCVILIHSNKARVAAEVIDGELIVQPTLSEIQKAGERGNKVELGVEYEPRTRKHVAYFVAQQDGDPKRVACYGARSGRLLAKMWYGSKYRCSDLRGKPIFSAMLEMAKKMERYQEAAVGTAEERQKIAWFFEHNQYSTGENPIKHNMRNSEDFGISQAGDQATGYAGADGNHYAAPYEVANSIAKTTNKQVINMPVGAKAHMPEFRTDLNFGQFYDTNGKYFYAALEIPYEIAMMMFTQSFSSSRAAAKIWDNTIRVKSKPLRENFFQLYYNIMLEVAVRQGLFKSEGLLLAYAEKNHDVINAYNTMRIVPTKMPHVDPVKEAAAERIKLGSRDKGDLPLISHDRATENLNEGDFEQNYQKFEQEIALKKVDT